MKKIRCTKCGYTGDYSEFPKGHDFFQHEYISGCPKCDNSQSPGDASMRMFHSDKPRPFEWADEVPASQDALEQTLRNAAKPS